MGQEQSAPSQPPTSVRRHAQPVPGPSQPSTSARRHAAPAAAATTTKSGSPQVQRRSLEDVCHFEQKAQMLGQGSFGTVFKARLKKDGRDAAVKIIEKARLKQLNLPSAMVATECHMMRQCVGQNLFVQLYDFVETNSKFCLVLEFCGGGNLQDAAMSCVEGTLDEAQVRLLTQQMLEAIAFLHSKHICHRDIKPHNYFLVGNITWTSAKVKLGDFGSAVQLPPGRLLTEQVGSPAFMAPEIHLLPKRSKGYDHKVDVWAIGVCMIFLLANEYPFFDGQGRLLRERIIRGGAPLWEQNSFENLFQGFQEAVGMIKKRPSKVARYLTRRLLAPCSKDRISAAAALQHDWFVKPIATDTDYDNLPLLDMKDFEDGFSQIGKMGDQLGNELGVVVDALSKMPIGVDVPSHVPARPYAAQQNIGALPGRSPPNLSWQHAPPGAHNVAEQQRGRFFSDITNSVPSASISKTRGRAESWASPTQPHAAEPTPMPRQHQSISSTGGSHSGCCICRSEASMFDHICPCCSAHVCPDCICNRLPKGNLHCPACGDSSKNEENMQLIFGINEARMSIGSLWTSIVGGIDDTSSKTNMRPTRPHGNMRPFTAR